MAGGMKEDAYEEDRAENSGGILGGFPPAGSQYPRPAGCRRTGYRFVEGISVQGAWNYDRHGLYLAQADASGAVSRVSTEQGCLQLWRIPLRLYSGDFDKNCRV